MKKDNLLKILESIYDKENLTKILNGYKEEKYSSFRLNTLKASKDIVLKELQENDYEIENINWYDKAYLIKKKGLKDIQELDCYKLGYIYRQSLSSMLPVLVLNPQAQETILDMTAAPGSKTTQIAMETNNQAAITAVEKNLIRQERLKYNLEKQGVTCATIIKTDARDLDELFSFDKVLLDAPCSGSGTITNSTKDYQIFAPERLKKLQRTQIALLTKALKVLKKGHSLVYSTCSILPFENEEVLKEVQKKIPFDIVPIDLDKAIPTLPTKIPGTICVCPNKYFEGFFLAKIIKK